MSNELVSIIIPVYNSEKYISETLKSVTTQKHKNIEILVINDGCTDGSESIILAHRDPRIKYFKQNNKGVSAARNLGLDKMQGDYFCFLDADDIMPENSITARLEIFNDSDKVDFVDGNVMTLDHNYKINERWSPSFSGYPLKEIIHITERAFFGNTWMFKNKHTNVRFNIALTHGEDLLFCIENCLRGGIYEYTQETVLIYRIGHHSAMSNVKGLEAGYKELYKQIASKEEIPRELSKVFLKKCKSIMFKCYLAAFNPLAAFRIITNKW